MSKEIIITCNQLITYKQIHTVTDEEYEIIKDFELDDVALRDKGYDILEMYINQNDVFDTEEEFTDVRIELADKIKKKS